MKLIVFDEILKGKTQGPYHWNPLKTFQCTYLNQWTASIGPNLSAGNPTVSRTIIPEVKAGPGTPEAPIDTKVAKTLLEKNEKVITKMNH